MESLNITAHINKPGAIAQVMTTGVVPQIGGALRPFHRLDLLHKRLNLGPCQINQFWFDRNQLYPTRNRSARMYQPIVDAYWDLCQAESTDRDPEVQENYLLAKLLPNIRDQKAREVFRDSVPSRRFDTEPKEEVSTDLEDLLSRNTEAMPVPDFHRSTADVLGPPEYAEENWELYDEMAEQLLAPGRERLPISKDEAVAEVRRRWQEWLTSIGRRRRGGEREKLMLDILSHESKAAFHRAYSLVWSELIQVLSRNHRLDNRGDRFHRFWHSTMAQKCQAYPTQYAHLFHGHVFGLHPASAMFIQTTTGRRLIGDWLLDDCRERYELLLSGINLAIFHYSTVYDERRHNRRVRMSNDLRDI